MEILQIIEIENMSLFCRNRYLWGNFEETKDTKDVSHRKNIYLVLVLVFSYLEAHNQQ